VSRAYKETFESRTNKSRLFRESQGIKQCVIDQEEDKKYNFAYEPKFKEKLSGEHIKINAARYAENNKSSEVT